MSRRNDRRLPVDDKVLDRTLHELLVVQRKCPLHDVAQLGLGLGVRAPEEEAQAAKFLLELLVACYQQEAEHVVDSLYGRPRPRRTRRKREWAFASLAPPWYVENHVVI
jgi:hypothetical protein